MPCSSAWPSTKAVYIPGSRSATFGLPVQGRCARRIRTVCSGPPQTDTRSPHSLVEIRNREFRGPPRSPYWPNPLRQLHQRQKRPLPRSKTVPDQYRHARPSAATSMAAFVRCFMSFAPLISLSALFEVHHYHPKSWLWKLTEVTATRPGRMRLRQCRDLGAGCARRYRRNRAIRRAARSGGFTHEHQNPSVGAPRSALRPGNYAVKSRSSRTHRCA